MTNAASNKPDGLYAAGDVYEATKDFWPPDETSNQQLEPCKFCGGESVIVEFYDGNDPQPLFVATCKICPVKTYDQFSPEEAARIWNSRSRVSDGGVVTKVIENLKAIITRCDDGDPRSNWLPIISRLAKEALAATASPAAPKEEARCKCGLEKDDPIHSFSTEWQQMHTFVPATTPSPDAAKP